MVGGKYVTGSQTEEGEQKFIVASAEILNYKCVFRLRARKDTSMRLTLPHHSIFQLLEIAMFRVIHFGHFNHVMI